MKKLLILIIILLSSPIFAKMSKEYKKGVKFFFQKKFEMAEIMFQTELQKNPENIKAYSYLGDIYLKKKKFNGALNLFKKAIEINPNIAKNYFRLGEIYYHKKIGNLAIDNYKKAYQLDNSLKFVFFQIGLTYLMVERDKGNTIKNWEKFINLAPEDPQYENILRVIQILKNPKFKIPPIGSEISIQEALLMGGISLTEKKTKTKDKKEGNVSKKTNKKTEGLYLDDDM